MSLINKWKLAPVLMGFFLGLFIGLSITTIYISLGLVPILFDVGGATIISFIGFVTFGYIAYKEGEL